MKKFLLALFVSIYAVSAFAIQADRTTITRKQAVEDIDYMVRFINETHPDMFAVYPEEAFMKEVEKVK